MYVCMARHSKMLTRKQALVDLKWEALNVMGNLNSDRKEGNTGYTVFGGLARDVANTVRNSTQDDKKRTLPFNGDIDVKIDTDEDVKNFAHAVTKRGLTVTCNNARQRSRTRIYGQYANAAESLDISRGGSRVAVDFVFNGDRSLFPIDFDANMLAFKPMETHTSLQDIFNSLFIIDGKVHSSITTLYNNRDTLMGLCTYCII